MTARCAWGSKPRHRSGPRRREAREIFINGFGASFERRCCSVAVNWDVLLNLLVSGKAPAKSNYYFWRSDAPPSSTASAPVGTTDANDFIPGWHNYNSNGEKLDPISEVPSSTDSALLQEEQQHGSVGTSAEESVTGLKLVQSERLTRTTSFPAGTTTTPMAKSLTRFPKFLRRLILLFFKRNNNTDRSTLMQRKA